MVVVPWQVIGGIVGASLVMVGIGVRVLGMTPPDFRAGRGWFLAAALWVMVWSVAAYLATDRSVTGACILAAVEVAVLVLLIVGLRWIGSREKAFEHARLAPCVTLSVAKSTHPKIPSITAITVLAHNLTDAPAERVTADIPFPGTKYVAQVRCDSPVLKDHPITVTVYFSTRDTGPERIPADGLTTILQMARSALITMLGEEWARIRQRGPASSADRSVTFDVKYQDANGREYSRRHVLKYTLLHDDGVSISPL